MMMEQIRQMCSDLKLRDHLMRIEEAKCQQRDLEEATYDIEHFTRMLSPITDSISNTLNNVRDVLEIAGTDLDKLEAYTQEKEECIEELAQLIQEEFNKFSQQKKIVLNDVFDPAAHKNHVKVLQTQTRRVENDVKHFERRLEAAEADIVALRGALVDATNTYTKLTEKSAELSKNEAMGRKKLENVCAELEAIRREVSEHNAEKIRLQNTLLELQMKKKTEEIKRQKTEQKQREELEKKRQLEEEERELKKKREELEKKRQLEEEERELKKKCEELEKKRQLEEEEREPKKQREKLEKKQKLEEDGHKHKKQHRMPSWRRASQRIRSQVTSTPKFVSKTMIEESVLDKTVCSDDDDFVFDD